MKTNLMKKVLGFVLTLVMVCSMLPMTSNAAEGTTVYFTPFSEWKNDNAYFAVYYYEGVNNGWLKLENPDLDGIYKAVVPVGYSNIIFCRMDPGFAFITDSENWGDNWKGKWNQTGDLKLSTSTQGCLYTVTGWGASDGAWSHVDENLNGVCDLCDAYIDGMSALAGHSLVLDGKVGVKFHMELSDDVIADENAYMQFAVTDGSTSQVKVTEAVKDGDYYVFTCKVAAKEMASIITAQIISGENKGTEYTYKVRDYADELIARSTNDAEKAFVKAMLNYGAYAQTYFGYNTSDLANKNLSESDINNAIPENLDLSAYKATGTKAATDDYLGSYVANLLLESTTTFNIKVTPKDGVTINTINDVAEGSLTKEGNAYVVSFGEINASQLDDLCTVVVKDAASNTATLTFYPLTYCERVLATSDNVNLKNVVGALYMYNKAANDYVK